MFLLAVNIAFAVGLSDGQADRLTDHEKTVWEQYRPSFVTLKENNQATGVAALIDDSGYFVTYSPSVHGNTVAGETSTGKPLEFSVISRDGATQLALLKSDAWQARTARPLRAPLHKESEAETFLGVLPSGPIRAGYVAKPRIGVDRTSRRLVTLSEIRFEASTQPVAGALILCGNGDFLGTLNVTLERPDALSANVSQTANNFSSVQSGNSATVRAGTIRDESGPAEMTVAYTVGPDFIDHTLGGFLSPTHEAEYALLGIFCTDAIGGGAFIQQVTPGSPASKSGVIPGDILMSIGYSQITNQIDFAVAMLKQKVGKKITLFIKRGRGSLLVDVVPTKSSD